MVFGFDGIGWLETKNILPTMGILWLVSVSASKGGFLIGAYQDDDKGADSGSVYAYINDLILADDFEN